MPVLRVAKKRGEDGKEQVEASEVVNLPRWEANEAFSVVGKGLPRVEGAEKVTGRAVYAYDVRLPGQLYARVLRSPHPHARIRRIDTSRAAALPGVRAVLSSADETGITWYQEECPLFDTTLRLVGDEVAAVAADSEEIADDALRLIEVEYEPLPFVRALTAAQRPDAPKIHAGGNVAGEPQEYARGNVEAGFRQAEVIIDEEYTTATAMHNALEPHGGTAMWEGGRLTLWCSTQSVFDVREQVAQKLGVPAHRVRVIKQFMGGGFGAKQVAWKQDVIAALLARRSGRPVQLMLDRHAENLVAGTRNATQQRVRLGAKRDGTLTAIEAEIALETGAYQVGGEASNVAGVYQELYRCANVRTEQTAFYTNYGPTVAFRAPGYVEGAFALETAMDQLARELGMDPLDLRLKNYAGEDQQGGKPYTLPEGLRACYDRATGVFGWRGYRKPPAEGTKRRGVGLAASSWMGGSGHPPGYAWVKLNGDGSADVVTGTQDIGTGTRTGLTQVAAEELGFPMERVTLHLGDTGNGPYSPVSSGSATQPTIGPAIRAAALDAKRQLLEVAAELLDASPEVLSVRDGKIEIAGKPGEGVPVEKITGQIAPHMILGQGARGANPEDKTIRTFGAQCAEVEVDTATGEVTVLRVVASADCGRIINPTMVESQMVGGVTQGFGFALMEERVRDGRYGMPLNANLEEYKVPTVADIPRIEHAAVGIPDLEANPTGAKGVGEPPLIPTAPAIANAIYDAVGVRLYETPFNRRRLLEALAARGRAGDEGIRVASAATLEEAIGLLGRDGDGAIRPLAGGTDLLTLIKGDLVAPSRLIDIKRVPELASGIAEGDGGVTIGGADAALGDRDEHADPRAIHRADRGGGTGGDAATAEHGDDRWESAPATALLVFPQPVLPVLAEGGRGVPGARGGESAARDLRHEPVRGDAPVRPGDGAGGAGCAGAPARGGRGAGGAAGRVLRAADGGASHRDDAGRWGDRDGGRVARECRGDAEHLREGDGPEGVGVRAGRRGGGTAGGGRAHRRRAPGAGGRRAGAGAGRGGGARVGGCRAG
ncbi:MAG: molybdopterin cofactor-binding domain-containing protein [Thermomicrobiales bacterium]